MPSTSRQTRIMQGKNVSTSISLSSPQKVTVDPDELYILDWAIGTHSYLKTHASAIAWLIDRAESGDGVPEFPDAKQAKKWIAEISGYEKPRKVSISIEELLRLDFLIAEYSYLKTRSGAIAWLIEKIRAKEKVCDLPHGYTLMEQIRAERSGSNMNNISAT